MRLTYVLQATAAVLLASCSPITHSCTLIGCENGLAVQLGGAPAGPVRVEAWSELRLPVQVQECAADQPCTGVFFPGFAGQNVTVRVTTSAGVKTQEFTGVDYETLYPNGRRCGGACEQASLTVQL